MDALGLVLGAATGLGLAIWGGLRWGERLRDKPGWRYWGANAAVMLAGMFLVFSGALLAWGFIWTAGVGVMGGGITGLKYGYGKSVGVWRAVDRITGADELPRE